MKNTGGTLFEATDYEEMLYVWRENFSFDNLNVGGYLHKMDLTVFETVTG